MNCITVVYQGEIGGKHWGLSRFICNEIKLIKTVNYLCVTEINKIKHK